MGAPSGKGAWKDSAGSPWMGKIACDQPTPETWGPEDAVKVRLTRVSPWEEETRGPWEGGHAGVCLLSFKRS